jgi:hypothetical protein
MTGRIMVASGCFLFGSSARGDADSSSDIDVLLVYEHEPSILERQRAKELVFEQLGKECSFAEYTSERLSGMFSDGHLFAWHLYLEARALDVAGVSSANFAFPQPEPYLYALRDAMNFMDLLRSCAAEVARKTACLVYEAGLGYVAIRNIGMSLSALALTRPVFDRHVAFKVARALGTASPCRLEEYDLLVAARHSSQRGLDAPNLNVNALLSTLNCAIEWAEQSIEVINDSTVV